MQKIKFIIDELDVREICLSISGIYLPDQVTVTEDGNDVAIIIDNNCYTERILGRKILDKYYFARFQFIEKKPDIDYYEEFFMGGEELKFGAF